MKKARIKKVAEVRKKRRDRETEALRLGRPDRASRYRGTQAIRHPAKESKDRDTERIGRRAASSKRRTRKDKNERGRRRGGGA